jgi:hypothetical protein
MANKNPSQGFQNYKDKINRAGAPKLDLILKEIRELGRRELTDAFSNMLRMAKPEIKAVIENPSTCIKDLGIAKAILKWLESGDFRYIQPYIAYIFGLPKEKVELSSKDFKLQVEVIDSDKLQYELDKKDHT